MPAMAGRSDPGRRRPPGLLVIIGTFTVAASLSLILLGIGTPTGRTFGALVAPVCFLVVYGLWSWSELARRSVVALLALALIGEGLHLALLVASDVEPGNAKVERRIAFAVLRVWFTWWMIAYLRRDDMRALFVKPHPATGSTAEDAAHADG